MDGWLNEITLFEGEDVEAFKREFVRVSIYHRRAFSDFEVAQYVFRNAREPNLRAGQAAQVWAKDLDVQEQIRAGLSKGPQGAVADASETDLVLRALQIADNPTTEPRDRIAAIKLAGELQGFVKKSVEVKPSGKGEVSANDFLAALAAKLPA